MHWKTGNIFDRGARRIRGYGWVTAVRAGEFCGAARKYCVGQLAVSPSARAACTGH